MMAKSLSLSIFSTTLFGDLFSPFEIKGGGGLLNTSWNGVVFVDACNVILYHNSAYGIKLCHSLGCSLQKHLSYVYVSRHLLTLSLAIRLRMEGCASF